MERIAVLEEGEEVSHLSVRLDEPASGSSPFCFLYLHGFASDQSGEKADFFRRKALADGFPFVATEDLLVRYRTPCLLLQGKKDTSVDWRSVVDFAAGCAYEGIDLHLFADGDHRLTDRKERLWELMTELLRGRNLI